MPGQTTLADLGTPLSAVTFVVVDLETTGGSPADAGITEIGAVRVRGGQVLGTFQTLVNPGVPIPAFVAALTGITDATVADAPPLRAALPAFLEFARLTAPDTVLVAHNAPYDVGFLTAACRVTSQEWSRPTTVDTARLARVALLRDEVPNCKLGTLAAHVGASVTPSHRALDDAQATVDVLHALLERAAGFGVQTLPDLQEFCGRVTSTQRAKRHLADGLPDAPGVYVFRDAQGTALYVGTSTRIRSRVRTYFTASEQRRRMAEMVRIAERVVPIVCATPLEARVRELRLIASEQPRYNRQSRRPHAQRWLKLTAEAAPRLSIVAAVSADADRGARYLGPYPSAARATEAAEALLAAVPLRTCTDRLARAPRALSAGCIRAELGRCLAPCRAGHDAGAYAEVVGAARAAMEGDLGPVSGELMARVTALAAEERFEEAGLWRDRLAALAGGTLRAHRLAMLADAGQIVAAALAPDGAWEIHVVRYGRLAAAGRSAAGDDPRPRIEALIDAAEHVEPAPRPAPAGLVEEATEILAWLDSPGVRLVRVDNPLTLPWPGAGRIDATLARSRGRAVDLAAEPPGRPHGPREARPVSRLRTA